MSPPGRGRVIFFVLPRRPPINSIDPLSWPTISRGIFLTFIFWGEIMYSLLVVSIFAPIASMILSRLLTSRSGGTFLSLVSLVVSRLAAIRGRAAFLEPLTFMVPDSFLPPLMMNLDINMLYIFWFD